MKLPRKVTKWLSNYFIARAKRTPYSHIDGYMNRYWLVPYNDPKAGDGCGPVEFAERPIAWLLQQFDIAVRVHHILRSDTDRHFHDHPWAYISFILEGGYLERFPIYGDSGLTCKQGSRVCARGQISYRPAQSFHRLDVPATAWTLFVTFKKEQTWGFLVHPVQKQAYYEYLKEEQK